jgi:hypothetical protein
VRENLVVRDVVAKRGDGDAVNHHAVKLGLAVADGAPPPPPGEGSSLGEGSPWSPR